MRQEELLEELKALVDQGFEASSRPRWSGTTTFRTGVCCLIRLSSVSLMVGTEEHCEWDEANPKAVGQSNLASVSAEPSAHSDEPSICGPLPYPLPSHKLSCPAHR